MAVVYLITCNTTSKQYVGFTKRSMYKRWAEHCREARFGSPLELHRAIRDHSSDDFTLRVIAQGSDADMIAAEIRAIAELNTLAPSGYNLTTGGEDQKGLSDDSRRRMSSSAKRRAASEDRTEQLRAAARHRWSLPGAASRLADTATRKRAALARADATPPEVVAAIRERYATGNVSQTALADEYRISQATVSNIVRGRRW